MHLVWQDYKFVLLYIYIHDIMLGCSFAAFKQWLGLKISAVGLRRMSVFGKCSKTYMDISPS